MSVPAGIMARGLKEGAQEFVKSDTAKGLSATAVAMGLVASPEEAEAAYIPLRAFRTGTDAAKKLYDDVTKLVDEGIDDAPGGELYQRTGAYRSEDGDIKIDVAELKARDQEAQNAVETFLNDTEKVITTSSNKVVGRMGDYLPDNSPVFRYFPELKNTEVRIVPRTEKGKNSSLGYYTPEEQRVTVTVPKIKGAPPEEVNKRLGKIFNTLVHEFQHNIQDVKYAQNVGGGFKDTDFTAMINAYKKNYKSAKPKLEKLQAENKFDPSNPEHAKLADQVAQVERLTQDMNITPDDFMDTTATELKKSKFKKHKIYIRELGEMEARSAGRKKLLTEDDPQRKAVGVFYPKLSADPGTMQAKEILSEPALMQEDALVRVYPNLDDAFEDYTYSPLSPLAGKKVHGLQRHLQPPVPVDTSKVKKGVGIAAASTVPPSQALADELGLSTERVNTAEEMGLTEDDESALNYLEMRTGARPTTVGSAPSDVLTDSPVVGDALMASDLLQMASEISPAAEEDTSAEPADEFSNIQRGMNQGGGLMKNEYNQLNPTPQQFPPPVQGTQVKPQYSLDEPLMMEMRQGGGVETEAGEEMAKDNPNKAVPKVADLDKDGTISSYEKTRHEAIQKSMKEDDKTEMAMGGIMQMDTDPFAPMQVVIGVDEVSGNEVPAGSKDEEVRDDIPAMLSEGEYVVPADVVRWHGLKTFEELRCEAKNAMGLMAMHDRISFVDDDTKEPVDYASPASPSIEEKNKPEVEEAEVKVIKAQEGTSVEPLSDPTFYRYEVRLDPVTNRYRRVPIDPITGMEVSEADFDPARSTRYSVSEQLQQATGRKVQCPEGYTYDEEKGICVPEETEEDTTEATVDVETPDGGGPSEADVTTTEPTSLRDYASYQLAETVGPNTELKTPESALERALEPTDIEKPSIVSTILSPLTSGLRYLGRFSDAVGAQRAMLQREDLIQEQVSDTLSGTRPASDLPDMYNLDFNPEDANFTATRTDDVAKVQAKDDGTGWVTDTNPVGASGKVYTGTDYWDDPKEVEDVFEGIESQFSDGVLDTDIQGQAPSYAGTVGIMRSDQMPSTSTAPTTAADQYASTFDFSLPSATAPSTGAIGIAAPTPTGPERNALGDTVSRSTVTDRSGRSTEVTTTTDPITDRTSTFIDRDGDGVKDSNERGVVTSRDGTPVTSRRSGTPVTSRSADEIAGRDTGSPGIGRDDRGGSPSTTGRGGAGRDAGAAGPAAGDPGRGSSPGRSGPSTSASPGSRGPMGGPSPGRSSSPGGRSSSPGGRGGSPGGRGGSPGGAGSPGGGGGGGGSPGTFICTAAYDTGLTSSYVWSLDKKFGISVRKNDPYLYKGYEVFGPWLAKQIRGGRLKSFAELTPKIWAYEQAKNTHGNVNGYPAHVKVLSHVYQYTTRPMIRVLGWIKDKVK